MSTFVPEDPSSALYRLWKRLSRCESEEEMLAVLPVEICQCGFTRVTVTALTENVGRVVSTGVAADSEASANLLATLEATQISLAGLAAESEMLRKMEPILVDSIDESEPILTRMARAVGSDSYVAAPVLVGERPALMLHADRPGGSGLTAADADRLGVIAVIIGRTIEQSAFRRRIATLRAEVRRANTSVRVVLDDHLNAPLQLVSALDLDDDLSSGRSLVSWFLAPSGGPAPTLTKREREVMDSVAAGLSNAQIAATLVISEQTVRSHLKRILRKLRASNRAEAVARWIALSNQSMPSGPSSAPARN